MGPVGCAGHDELQRGPVHELQRTGHPDLVLVRRLSRLHVPPGLRALTAKGRPVNLTPAAGPLEPAAGVATFKFYPDENIWSYLSLYSLLGNSERLLTFQKIGAIMNINLPVR